MSFGKFKWKTALIELKHFVDKGNEIEDFDQLHVEVDTEECHYPLHDITSFLLGMSAQKAYKILEEKGICHCDYNAHWYIDYKYSEYHYAEIDNYQYAMRTGYGINPHLKWSLKGAAFVYSILKEYKE